MVYTFIRYFLILLKQKKQHSKLFTFIFQNKELTLDLKPHTVYNLLNLNVPSNVASVSVRTFFMSNDQDSDTQNRPLTRHRYGWHRVWEKAETKLHNDKERQGRKQMRARILLYRIQANTRGRGAVTGIRWRNARERRKTRLRDARWYFLVCNS